MGSYYALSTFAPRFTGRLSDPKACSVDQHNMLPPKLKLPGKHLDGWIEGKNKNEIKIIFFLHQIYIKIHLE